MNQVALSIKQTERLKELGLNTNDASMFEAMTYGHYIDAESYKRGIYSDHLFDVFCPVYTFQDLLKHLNPAFQRLVINYSPDEWMDIAYAKLIFQLEHPDDFKNN